MTDNTTRVPIRVSVEAAATPLRIVTPTSPVTQRGMGYAAEFACGVEMVLARVRSSRGELGGDLTVSLGDTRLYRGRFNVSSLTSRKTASTYLLARAGRVEGINWADLLERFCFGVLEAHQAPIPTVEIGREPVAATGVRCLLDPYMPHGEATLLFGPGGVSKSTLAASLAVSVASGVAVVPGWQPVDRGRVSVFDWESSAPAWSVMVRQAAAGVGIESPEGIHYHPLVRSLADEAEEVARVVQRHSPLLVVVDSVGLACGTSRDGGDAAETALRMFSALRAIREAAGSRVPSFLLIDHVTGADLDTDKAAASKPYGSIYKVNLARSVVELRSESAPEGAARELLVLHRKVNIGPLQRPLGLRLTHGDGTLAFERCEVSAPELEQRSGTTAERMRRLLRNGAMPERELAEDLGISASTIRSVLRRHSAFQRLGNGRIGLRV
jgi:AAA domain